MKFDFDQFKQLLTLLATTPGPSNNEEKRSVAIKEIFNQAGIHAEIDEVNNVLVSLGFGKWEDAVIYDTHIDVVGRGVADRVVEKNGRLIGAGVADTLTTAVMLILLAKDIVSSKAVLKRPLKLLFSVGEEGLGDLRGIRHIVKTHDKPPFLFIGWDFTYREYYISGAGSKRYKISVDCPGGHSWIDFGKPSATEYLIEFMTNLKAQYKKTAANADDILTFNVGTITGSEGNNCISRHAESTFEFRTEIPSLLEKADILPRAILENEDRADEIQVNLEIIGDRPAAKRFANEKIEKIWCDLCAKNGIDTKPEVGSTNANIPLTKNWPSICTGLCCGGNIHREDEYIEIDSLEIGWKLLNQLSDKLLR